jgi:hypothetical protein
MMVTVVMMMMMMVMRGREHLLHHASSANIAYRGKLGSIQSRTPGCLFTQTRFV